MTLKVLAKLLAIHAMFDQYQAQVQDQDQLQEQAQDQFFGITKTTVHVKLDTLTAIEAVTAELVATLARVDNSLNKE